MASSRAREAGSSSNNRVDGVTSKADLAEMVDREGIRRTRDSR